MAKRVIRNSQDPGRPDLGQPTDGPHIDHDPLLGASLIASLGHTAASAPSSPTGPMATIEFTPLKPSAKTMSKGSPKASKQVNVGRSPAGVEITSHTVRVVHPGSGRFGEAPLPPGAVSQGEILDPVAVGTVLKELWKDAKIPTHSVVFGVNNQDVVARQVDLPMLDAKDTKSALRFELGDMVPFPIASAMVDMRFVEETINERNVAQQRVLAVAALRSMLRTYVATAKVAKLRVKGIDYLPLALVRAAAVDDLVGTQAIVSVGDEALTVVVHSDGLVRFCRSVLTQAVTSSASGELEEELNFIENYRQRSEGGDVVAVRSDPLIEAIHGTLEYYSIQPGATKVDSVALIGSSERATQVGVALAALLGVRVGLVDPLDKDRPFQPGPYFADDTRSMFAPAFGLGLLGDNAGGGPARLELIPDRERKTGPKALAIRVAMVMAVAAGAMFVATKLVGPDVDTPTAERDAAVAQLEILQRQLIPLSQFRKEGDKVRVLEDKLTAIGPMQVDWSRLIVDIRLGAPTGTTLVSIDGAGPTKDKTEVLPGTLKLVGRSSSQANISAWLTAISEVPGVANPWLGSITAKEGVEATFTITAELNDDALQSAGITAGSFLQSGASAATGDGGSK